MSCTSCRSFDFCSRGCHGCNFKPGTAAVCIRKIRTSMLYFLRAIQYFVGTIERPMLPWRERTHKTPKKPKTNQPKSMITWSKHGAGLQKVIIIIIAYDSSTSNFRALITITICWVTRNFEAWISVFNDSYTVRHFKRLHLFNRELVLRFFSSNSATRIHLWSIPTYPVNYERPRNARV